MPVSSGARDGARTTCRCRDPIRAPRRSDREGRPVGAAARCAGRVWWPQRPQKRSHRPSPVEGRSRRRGQRAPSRACCEIARLCSDRPRFSTHVGAPSCAHEALPSHLSVVGREIRYDKQS
jgi:hypothetical protein